MPAGAIGVVQTLNSSLGHACVLDFLPLLSCTLVSMQILFLRWCQKECCLLPSHGVLCVVSGKFPTSIALDAISGTKVWRSQPLSCSDTIFKRSSVRTLRKNCSRAFVSVVEWRDDAAAVVDGSGNITLRINRAGFEDAPVCRSMYRVHPTMSS